MRRECVFTFCHGIGEERQSSGHTVVIPECIPDNFEAYKAYILLLLSAKNYVAVDSIEIDINEIVEE